MEYGYKLENNRKGFFLPFIFHCVKTLSEFITNKSFYKINSIKYNKDNYYITFFIPGERLTFVKSAPEIFKQKDLITKFNYKDASLIGFCMSNPTKEQFEKIKSLRSV